MWLYLLGGILVEELVGTPTKTKKKREKPEDFIGWKSEDGKLEVIGIHGKTKSSNTLYKVICEECSKDRELFPEEYFVCTKGHLKDGVRPCGCSKIPKWKGWQYLILSRREGEKKGFIVHGFSEEFKNQNTKLELECIKDHHEWVASTASIINGGTGCPKCAGNLKLTNDEAGLRIAAVCNMKGYNFIEFIGKFKNAYSRFRYSCIKHGIQEANYNNFVNSGKSCKYCSWEVRGFYGYYPERKDEQDFLYVLDFNGKFIKVGRSFDVDQRVGGLKSISKVKNIIKHRIFTATHQEIYDYEQFLLNSLRPNFKYYCDWSTETLVNPSLPILNDLLDTTCKFKELKLEGI